MKVGGRAHDGRATQWRLGLVTVGAALLVYVVSLPAILLRPAGLDWAVWWPAAGIALGLVVRTPRRHVPMALVVLTAIFVVAQISSGRDVVLATCLGVASGAEVAVAHAILRGSRDRAPRLVRLSDLTALLGASIAGVTVLTVTGALSVAVLLGPGAVVDYLQISALAHLAGMLVVTPLFFDLGRVRFSGRWRELSVQWLSVFGTLGLTAYAAAGGFPLAFVLLGPLVWGAARFGGPQFIVQYIVVMALASDVGSGDGGMIAVAGIEPETSALMVQLFILSTGVVLLAVLVLSANNRRLVHLSHAAIAASITGFAELRRRGGDWTTIALNDAARLVLGASERDVSELFDDESAALLAAAADREPDSADSLGGVERLTTRDGRVLQATIAPLIDPDQSRRGDIERRYSLQFSDITDSLHLAQLEEDERRRAADIQRALLPETPPELTGWQVAGACRPSRDVGGDFYAWSSTASTLSVTLGDVMGKGLGAGVMAASIQMAVNLQASGSEPGEVVTRAGIAVSRELDRASTFATLFHAQFDLATGSVRFADAGHGLSIVVSSGGYRRLASDGLPLGIDPTSSWASIDEQLHPGDLLLIISDGVLDAFPTASDPLCEIAALAHEGDSAAGIVESVAHLASGVSISDDVTVVAVRRV